MRKVKKTLWYLVFFFFFSVDTKGNSQQIKGVFTSEAGCSGMCSKMVHASVSSGR